MLGLAGGVAALWIITAPVSGSILFISNRAEALIVQDEPDPKQDESGNEVGLEGHGYAARIEGTYELREIGERTAASEQLYLVLRDVQLDGAIDSGMRVQLLGSIARSLRKQARADRSEGDLSSATEHLTLALDIYRHVSGRRSTRTLLTFAELADAHERQGKIDQAGNEYFEVEQELRKDLRGVSRSPAIKARERLRAGVANSLFDLTRRALATGSKAPAAIEDWLFFVKQYFVDVGPRRAVQVRQAEDLLLTTWRQKGEFDKAEKLLAKRNSDLEKAVKDEFQRDPYVRYLSTKHREWLRARHGLALLWNMKGEKERSESEYRSILREFADRIRAPNADEMSVRYSLIVLLAENHVLTDEFRLLIERQIDDLASIIYETPVTDAAYLRDVYSDSEDGGGIAWSYIERLGRDGPLIAADEAIKLKDGVGNVLSHFRSDINDQMAYSRIRKLLIERRNLNEELVVATKTRTDKTATIAFQLNKNGLHLQAARAVADAIQLDATSMRAWSITRKNQEFDRRWSHYVSFEAMDPASQMGVSGKALMERSGLLHDVRRDIPNLEKIQHALGDRTMLIFRVFPNLAESGSLHLGALVITNHEVRHIPLGPWAPIEALVQKFRAACEATDSELDSLNKMASELFRLIWLPLQLHLPSDSRVLVSADSGLHFLPFSALFDSDAGKYLVEVYRLSILASPVDILNGPSRTAPTKAPVIVYDPRFSLEGSERPVRCRKDDRRSATSAPESFYWGELCATRTEGEHIRSALASLSPEYLTREGATETRVKRVHGPRFLHFATHAYYAESMPGVAPAILGGQLTPALNADAMLKTGIVLAGANDRSYDETADDGILTALEVSGLDLVGTEMVVLAACQTGLGDLVPGERVASLYTAFLDAGAQSVIYALWKVDDRATDWIMTDIYSGFSSHPDANAEDALRTIQRKMIRRTDAWREPRFWAGFSVVSRSQL